jgi:hypothetical protein
MTPEAQRIAIAEACGWQIISDYGSDGVVGFDTHSRTHAIIPEYLNDLNAMHEAALHLRIHSKLKYAIYHSELECLVAISNSREEFGVLTPDATAAQRAKAFLRAIGKWAT